MLHCLYFFIFTTSGTLNVTAFHLDRTFANYRIRRDMDSRQNHAKPWSGLNTAESDDNASQAENNSRNLMDLLTPDPSCNVQRMSGTDLAYIGDVVFELFVRSRCVWPPKRTSELQFSVVECVRGMYNSLQCCFATISEILGLLTSWLCSLSLPHSLGILVFSRKPV